MASEVIRLRFAALLKTALVEAGLRGWLPPSAVLALIRRLDFRHV
jgi:hypothetical protein